MQNAQKGLTLVELMVTLAVAIILIAVGMPLFTGVVGSNRVTGQTNGLVAALQLARSESVKRGLDSFVCASSGTLSVDCAATDWSDGWSVFADTDDDGALDSGELLRVWDDIGNSTLTLTGGTSIRYLPSGELQSATPVTFELANPDAGGTQERCVTVGITGQVRSERGACP
jgi:type IV fimbrial biogenesis protein FimT